MRLLLLFFLPLAGSAAIAQSVIEPERSAEVAYSWYRPMPPHLDFRPMRHAIGVDLAPVMAWYGEMPLMGLFWHGVDDADASGVGYSVGLSGMYWYPHQLAGMRVGVRYLHQCSDASLARSVPGKLRTGPGAGDTTSSDRQNPVLIEASSDFHLLAASVLYVQNISGHGGDDGLLLYVGPSTSIVMAAHRFETVELDPAVSGEFFNESGLPAENNGRKLILHDGEPQDLFGLRVGLIVGLQYELRVASDLAILPTVEYDFALAGVSEQKSEGKQHLLSARAAVQWYFW